jgi:hypothetical protein
MHVRDATNFLIQSHFDRGGILIVILTISLFVCSPTAQAEPSEGSVPLWTTAVDGNVLYEKFCQGCHGSNGTAPEGVRKLFPNIIHDLRKSRKICPEISYHVPPTAEEREEDPRKENPREEDPREEDPREENKVSSEQRQALANIGTAEAMPSSILESKSYLSDLHWDQKMPYRTHLSQKQSIRLLRYLNSWCESSD